VSLASPRDGAPALYAPATPTTDRRERAQSRADSASREREQASSGATASGVSPMAGKAPMPPQSIERSTTIAL